MRLRRALIASRGRTWFERVPLPRLARVSVTALLVTLVLVCAFGADSISSKTLR